MIVKEDMDYLREMFVLRADCDRTAAEKGREIAEMRQDVAVIATKINMLLGILGAIAVPVLAIAIKLLFGD